MRNRRTFLYRLGTATTEGATEKGTQAGFWTPPVKACRPQGRQIRPAHKAETRDEAARRSCGAHAPWKNP